MSPRRNFRHDAAKGRVLLNLAADDVGEDAARAVRAALNDCGGGFITAGFNAKDAQGVWQVLNVRPIRPAI
jgi:hypothetical protein